MISFKSFFVNPKWNFGSDHFNLAAAVGYSLGASKALTKLHSTIAVNDQPAKEVTISMAVIPAIPTFKDSKPRCNAIFRLSTKVDDLQMFIVPETLLLSTASTSWSKMIICYDVTHSNAINEPYDGFKHIKGSFKRASNGDLMIKLVVGNDEYVITCPYKILEHVQKFGKVMYQLKDLSAGDLLEFAKDHKLVDVTQPSDVKIAARNLVVVLK